jgi:hypothetical protein
MATALALAGCGSLEAPKPDDFSGWRATPMEPDRTMAETASRDQACQARSILLDATMPPPMVLPMHVELQDRRTQGTAAFIVSTVGYIGSCFVSSAAQTVAVGHLFDLPIPGLTDGMAVVGDGGGILGAGEASYLWGQADARVARVSIDLIGHLHDVDLDNRVVVASVGGGYWLAWWPDSAQANVVQAVDADGAIVATLKRTDDGWIGQ